jgi:hypothetical protein
MIKDEWKRLEMTPCRTLVNFWGPMRVTGYTMAQKLFQNQRNSAYFCFFSVFIVIRKSHPNCEEFS